MVQKKDECIVRIGSRNSLEGAYVFFWGARMPIQRDNNSQAQDVSIGFETMHHQSGWSYLICFQKNDGFVVSCFPSCSFVVDCTSVVWYGCCEGFLVHGFPCWFRLKFTFISFECCSWLSIYLSLFQTDLFEDIWWLIALSACWCRTSYLIGLPPFQNNTIL